MKVAGGQDNEGAHSFAHFANEWVLDCREALDRTMLDFLPGARNNAQHIAPFAMCSFVHHPTASGITITLPTLMTVPTG